MIVIHARIVVPATVSNVGYPHIMMGAYTRAMCAPYLGFKHDKPMTIWDDRVTCKRCLRLIEQEN